jgi:hypothetical protein
MNTAVRSHCFLDELTMATSGLDADVYIWDLRKTGRCVARWVRFHAARLHCIILKDQLFQLFYSALPLLDPSLTRYL